MNNRMSIIIKQKKKNNNIRGETQWQNQKKKYHN